MLARTHRQLCADFLRDHRNGMDIPAVGKLSARTCAMSDRVDHITASLALSNLPDNNNDGPRHVPPRRLTAWPRALRRILIRQPESRPPRLPRSLRTRG